MQSFDLSQQLEKIKEVQRPGLILEEEYLKAREITRYRLSKDTGVPESTLSDIFKGKRGFTPDTSVRIGAYLGLAPDYFLNLQTQYDLYIEVTRNREKYLAIKICTTA